MEDFVTNAQGYYPEPLNFNEEKKEQQPKPEKQEQPAATPNSAPNFFGGNSANLMQLMGLLKGGNNSDILSSLLNGQKVSNSGEMLSSLLSQQQKKGAFSPDILSSLMSPKKPDTKTDNITPTFEEL